MKEMFKQIPQNVEKPLTSREKKSKIDDRYWWWMVFEKCERGLPPLKRKKLSKKTQERHDFILKKLYQYNRWWSDWRFQLHWNNIECVDLK